MAHEENTSRLGHIITEVKKQSWLLVPIIVSGVLEKLIQIISLSFVGHLGDLPLSAASMAASISGITGMSILMGMLNALDTLCGQAYGAKEYHLLGIYLQRAMLLNVVTCIPLAFVWPFAGKILHAIGQNEEISMAAQLYIRYVWFSSKVKETWTGFSKQASQDFSNTSKLAFTSALMNCLDFWSFEVIFLMYGYLPNPKLETSVLAISQNTSILTYMIPVGIGASLSTRVSNELGAGNQQNARFAIYIAGTLAILEGVTRGCGWQKLGVFVNFSAYYIVGLPFAGLFAFYWHLKVKGLWLGIMCGLSIQLFLLLIITVFADWEKVARKAVDRVNKSTVATGRITTMSDNPQADNFTERGSTSGCGGMVTAMNDNPQADNSLSEEIQADNSLCEEIQLSSDCY
ncbi:protein DETOXIFICATION 16-like [Dioscorea cayenensis subsp. rotundata]|uniref:Protein DETOXIFICATION 16-like n=1 Tax=Dioscorea cayennensis subsp. rotundata TaxID=55577 RepID=A0AB40AT43_DIOCR|nr:protein DETOXIFICATION 16-like [Dioscorea cayenensis subsp. rotundata]